MPTTDYDYFEIKIPCHKSEIVSIEDKLMFLGACSVTYRDAEDVAILEPAPGEMPLWQDIEVTGMFTKDYDEQSIQKSIQNQFTQREIICEKLQNQVWERTWLEHFKPMLFGQTTWIIPSEFEVINEDAVNIMLDPGMAFGTGTHATTALCLEWIDEHDLQGQKVIDFGCGSGILAIAALKHGAQVTYCTDIDPQAIESTLINAENNQVSEGIQVVATNKVLELEQLDVVLANILAAPLMSLVATFKKILKEGGELVMSGILAEQTDEVIEKFSQSFIDFQVKITDDWASVYAKKRTKN
jgi:ribosomal protein L11 methyltransferase